MVFKENQLKTLVSHKIKSLMTEHGLSENTLSRQTGISQSAVNRIKNGQVSPSLLQALQIANYFGLTLDEFIRVDMLSHYQSEDAHYIPVIDSALFLNEGKTLVKGFCSFKNIHNAVGFKFDKSFSCNIFNDNTVVVIKKSEAHDLRGGDTVLFVKNGRFIVASYNSNTLKPLDNLTLSYSLDEVVLIGAVIKIETSYIKEPSTVEKIVEAIGELKLQKLIDSQTPKLGEVNI